MACAGGAVAATALFQSSVFNLEMRPLSSNLTLSISVNLKQDLQRPNGRALLDLADHPQWKFMRRDVILGLIGKGSLGLLVWIFLGLHAARAATFEIADPAEFSRILDT